MVAANSEDEAYNLVKQDNTLVDYLFEQFDLEHGMELPFGQWREQFNCYHRKDFRLLTGVTADVNTPQILAEDHYEE